MSPWEPLHNNLGNLDNLYLENLGSLQGTLKEPWGNLLGTFWEPWGNLEETWEPLLGNLGTFTWEPGNLYLGTFTWNLGTLGEWVLELLRSAPKPLLWLKTPKHSAVGEKVRQTSERWADASCTETISKPKLGGQTHKRDKNMCAARWRWGWDTLKKMCKCCETTWALQSSKTKGFLGFWASSPDANLASFLQHTLW